jgi:pyruvate, water dikinase
MPSARPTALRCAAIVCREYGLPAVVGTGFATSSLQTGQRVRVDGDRGEVEILS